MDQLQLPSTSSREGNTSPNFNLKHRDDNSVDTDMLKALMNPVILELIFLKLSLTDLKTARLVCQDWDVIGASLLGKRTFLNINQLFGYDGSNLQQTIPVNDKLKRRLLILGVFQPHIPTKKVVDVFTQMITRVPNLSQVTREIQFFVTQKKFAIAFLNAVGNLKTTNIQHVSIVVSQNSGVENARSRSSELCLHDDDPVQEFPKVPIQSNLTSIKLDHYPHIHDESVPLCETFFQVLINSAPNLTSLSASGTFYPNLEGCKKLKFLEFEFGLCPRPKLTLAGLIRMLAQVKESLTEMKLLCEWNNVAIIEGDNLDAPMMLELSSLAIHGWDLFGIHNFFDEDHLPKLQNLTITNSKFLANLNLRQRHRGVQSLIVDDSIWPGMDDRLSRKIVQLFPAVQKFHYTMSVKNSALDNNSIIEPFEVWDLEEAKLVANCETSSLWVEILKSMTSWKGVKRVHFKGYEVTYNEFSPCIQNLILYSRGFKSVQISMNGRPTVLLVPDPERMEKIIRPIFEARTASDRGISTGDPLLKGRCVLDRLKARLNQYRAEAHSTVRGIIRKRTP